MAKQNAFSKAAKKASSNGVSNGKKEKPIIRVDDEEVSGAINDFVDAHERLKTAEADKGMASGVILPHCEDVFFSKFAEDERKPDTMRFRSLEDKSVTLVAQDRGERYDVSEEQKSTLRTLLGKKTLKDVIFETTIFSFNTDILEKDGVMDVLGKAVEDLVKSGTLTQDEADSLLVAECKTRVRKGVLESLGRLCGNDPDLMKQVKDALGSHMSIYIKAS